MSATNNAVISVGWMTLLVLVGQTGLPLAMLAAASDMLLTLLSASEVLSLSLDLRAVTIRPNFVPCSLL